MMLYKNYINAINGNIRRMIKLKKIFYSLFAFTLFFSNFYVLESSANTSLSNFEQGGFKTVYKVTSSQIMIKEAPDSSSKTLGTEKKGTYLISDYTAEGGWLPVIYNGGYGFVDITGIAFDVPTTIKISSSKGGIVIKEKPTQNSNTIATLQYGMVMEDYGDAGNGYSFVQYGNVIGYAKTSFMKAPVATTKYINAPDKEFAVMRIIASASIDGWLVNHGTKVNHYTTIKGWAYVVDPIEGDSGYIPANQLSNNDPIKVKQPTKTSNPVQSKSGYKNCTELRKDYPGGVKRGHPAYEPKMDRDNDGHACE